MPPVYSQRFCPKWLKEPPLKDWIASDPSDSSSAKCKYFGSTHITHLKTLKAHARTEKHKKRTEARRIVGLEV